MAKDTRTVQIALEAHKWELIALTLSDMYKINEMGASSDQIDEEFVEYQQKLAKYAKEIQTKLRTI